MTGSPNKWHDKHEFTPADLNEVIVDPAKKNTIQQRKPKAVYYAKYFSGHKNYLKPMDTNIFVYPDKIHVDYISSFSYASMENIDCTQKIQNCVQFLILK